MNDVRDELSSVIERAIDVHVTAHEPWGDCLADAILARFEVTPKPVVTVEQLGDLVSDAYGNSNLLDRHRGERMLEFLAEAGLTIVRTEDGER